MTDLARVTAAERALAEVESVEDAKGLYDKLEALSQYARRYRVDHEKQNEIAELKIRTARKGGALIPGQFPRGNVPSRNLSLADAGLSRAQSSRWQALASIPEDQFEGEIADTKELRASLGPPARSAGAVLCRVPRPQRRRVEGMEAPTAGDGTESVFLFRLYGPGGEIATFATSVGVWEAGEVLMLPDGRRFEITSIAVVAGGDVDGLFEVSQVE